jgi:regulator of sigma E protease
MSILLLILGLLLFVALVVFHEFGHFIAARRNGVEVEEFGIGFPPRAKILKRHNGTIFSLNWLPLGGFVKLKGEHDSDTEPGSYGAATIRAKVRIMMAGVALNLVAAFAILTVVALIGMPQLIPDQFKINADSKVTRQEVYVGLVEKGSPADKAGIKQRDRLLSLSFEGQSYEIKDATDLAKMTKLYANKPVQITAARDGKTTIYDVNLRSKLDVDASRETDHPKGYLGIAPTDLTLRRSTWSAPIVAIGTMKQLTVDALKAIGSSIGNLFSGHAAKAAEQVSGPVGVFVILKDGSVLGPQFILFIIGVVSLTLAIMNILPIPALDGGRLFVTVFYRAFRKRLTAKAEDRIHGVGFTLLMLLFIVITINDIKRL